MKIYNSKFTLPPFHTTSRQPKGTLDSRNEWEEAKENVQIWSPLFSILPSSPNFHESRLFDTKMKNEPHLGKR